jgi:hypothetical protein
MTEPSIIDDTLEHGCGVKLFTRNERRGGLPAALYTLGLPVSLSTQNRVIPP